MADVQKKVIGQIAGDHSLHHVETQEKNPLPSKEGSYHSLSSTCATDTSSRQAIKFM